MCNINFADNWIRTTDLWSQKWLLYQLSHNHYHLFYSLGTQKDFNKSCLLIDSNLDTLELNVAAVPTVPQAMVSIGRGLLEGTCMASLHIRQYPDMTVFDIE